MVRLGKYPDLWFQDYLFTEGRVILADIPVQSEKREAISNVETIDGNGTIIRESSFLSIKLASLLKSALAILDSPKLIVLPGSGALRVWGQVSVTDSDVTTVFAKRYWVPGTKPHVEIGRIETGRIASEVRSVIVVDDVISSGETMASLRQNNVDLFPQAEWFGYSWMCQVPRQKCLSGIRGYAKVATALVAEGAQGRLVPINSLSTLSECSEIAESYARRHFVYPNEFLKLIRP